MQEKGSEGRTDPGTDPVLPTHSKRRKRSDQTIPRSDPDQESRTALFIVRLGGSLRDLIRILLALTAAWSGRRSAGGSHTTAYLVVGC